MTSYRIAFDVDGVLANFTDAYLHLLRQGGRTGTLKPGEDPDCWFWAERYGFTKEDDQAAWKAITSSPDFWTSLRPTMECRLVVDVLNMLYAHGHEVYFITNRPGMHPHAQTCYWLMARGIGNPQVIVTASKGPVLRALGITHFIDDRDLNCFEVKEQSPATKVFLLAKPYNNSAETRERNAKLDILRVPSCRYLFDALGAEENANALIV